MPDNLYYPALSRLINIDELPESLSFIQKGIEGVFDNVFYKDYINSVNIDGSNAFYNLTVVSKKKLAFELFGSGISFILNPDYDDSNISSFPVTLLWEWEILKYFSNFKLATFSFQPNAFFDFAIVILGINKEQALRLAISTFVTPADPSISSFGQLVTDINLLYSATIEIDEEDEDKYEQLISQIEQLDENVFITVFTLYLFDASLQVTKQRLNYFFGALIPTDLESYIKDLFIPRLRASFTLTAAMQFPRNVLLPMKETPEGLVPDDTLDADGQLKKTYFKFAEADFVFDTERGLYAHTELAGSIIPDKVQIGNTGFIIGFTNLKLDLSKTTNIPEADAAGYPTDFTGVFIETATIGLPKTWLQNAGAPPSSVEIIGKNLLIGTGGFSGTIALQRDNNTDLLHKKLGGFEIALSSFDITFLQNSITSSNIRGSLKIKGFKNALGQTAEIDISVHFDENGDFKVTAVEPQGIPLIIKDVFTFNVKSLTLGKQDGRYFIETAGSLLFTAQPPIGQIFDGPLEIGLLIWDDGTIQLKGLDGALKLKKPKTLQLGPAKITITAIHHGTHEQEYQGVLRKYWFFGFDGGININPGGIDARGDGIKLYFTVDNNGPLHVFFRIQSLTVDIIIRTKSTPAEVAVIIKGYLSMKEPSAGNLHPGKGTEYVGGVDVSLPRLGLAA